MSLTRSQPLSAIDALIRQGNFAQARLALSEVAHRRLPREDRLLLASLARRAGLPLIALKLLNPLVRPTRHSPQTANEAEKAEYAGSLIRVGALDEASKLLSTLKAEDNPQVYLFQVFTLFAQWDYASAIDPLQRYLDHPGLPEYQNVVGRVNMAASLVHERRFAQAETTLSELRTLTEAQGFSLLRGNVLELSAQNAIFAREFSQAEHFLSAAETVLSTTKSLDSFFVNKWKAILAVRKSGGDKKSLRALEALKQEAGRRRHWETIRDCDLQKAVATRNAKLVQHLYFGTRFPAYRHWLLKEASGITTVPAQYPYRIDDKKGKVVQRLELFSEKHQGFSLKVGQSLHRYLVALCSDFYRPFSVAALHAEVYPGDFFSPSSSPLRVRQGIKRLRQFFNRSRLPLKVQESEGNYFLKASGVVEITVRSEEKSEPRSQVLLDKLFEVMQDREFSGEDACQIFGFSKRTSQRILQQAVKENLLVRRGKTSAILYQFVRPPRSQAT